MHKQFQAMMLKYLAVNNWVKAQELMNSVYDSSRTVERSIAYEYQPEYEDAMYEANEKTMRKLLYEHLNDL